MCTHSTSAFESAYRRMSKVVACGAVEMHVASCRQGNFYTWTVHFFNSAL